MALRYFLILNEWEWTTTPTVNDAEAVVLAVASGKWDEAKVAAWLRPELHLSIGS